jgi:L-ascorbate oxidase
MMPDYYNRQQRTLFDFLDDAREKGFGAAFEERAMWGNMRMMPTDIEDLQGFTPLINGKSTEQNWTGLFKPGERVRLRFINSSAMAYFDVRIPGLKMTVVQADGNNVLPVPVDEFRIAVAETYDVLVQPKEDQAYAIFAESMGRTASVRATLATSEGMVADAPELRKPSLLTMADMGMAHEGMDHGSMSMGGMSHTMPDGRAMQGMNHGAMNQGQTNHGTGQMSDTHKMPDGSSMKGMSHAGTDHSGGGGMPTMKHDGTAMAQEGHTMPDGSIMKGTSHGGMNHGAQGMMAEADSFYAPGSGLTPSAANGGKFLSYDDLRAQKPLYEYREATREVELRLTGNMERYIWSINGVKFKDAEPIRLKYGERVRFKFVNETMMTHPMHLHGLWSILDTGQGKWNPVKHTISINPGTTVYSETEVDEPGEWAFHCHLSYHMATGMFRKVVVEGGPAVTQLESGN